MNEVVVTLRNNPQLAIQIFQQTAPGVFNELERVRSFLYKTLTGEQQTFLSAHISDLPNFLETTEGKQLFLDFLNKWKESSPK